MILLIMIRGGWDEDIYDFPEAGGTAAAGVGTAAAGGTAPAGILVEWDAIRDSNGNVLTSLHTVVVTGGQAVPNVAAEGDLITLYADSPEEGLVFAGWTGDGIAFEDAGSPVTTFAMAGTNVSVEAVFGPPSYPVTAEAENGTVTADCESAKAGTTVTLTLAPDAGYGLDTLAVTAEADPGTPLPLEQDPRNPAKYSFVMPAGPVHAAAAFRPVSHAVHVTAENGTAGTDKQTAFIGEDITLTLEAADPQHRPGTPSVMSGGESVAAELVSISDTGDTAVWRFLMPGDDVYIAAAFGGNCVISFVDWNGGLLWWEDALPSVLPVYGGETPVRESNALYHFTFSGWEPEIVPAAGDATYTAVYETAERKYTVVYQDEDGTELQRGSYSFWDYPEYLAEQPSKAPDEQYAYAFSGWDLTVRKVTESMTYTAVYTAMPLLHMGDNVIQQQPDTAAEYCFIPLADGSYQFRIPEGDETIVQVRDGNGRILAWNLSDSLEVETICAGTLEGGKAYTVLISTQGAAEGTVSIGTVNLYEIEYGDFDEHGDIDFEFRAWPGKRVEVRWFSEEGWVLDRLDITDAAGSRIEMLKDPVGFIMPASDVTVSPRFGQLLPVDIAADETLYVHLEGNDLYDRGDGGSGTLPGREVRIFWEDAETGEIGMPVTCGIMTDSGATVSFSREVMEEDFDGVHYSRPYIRFTMPEEGVLVTINRVQELPSFGDADFILPRDTAEIEEGAFENDTAITAVDASGCGALGAGAFRGCTELTKIRLPKDCIFGEGVFDGCMSLTAIFGEGGGTTQTWAEARGILFVNEPPAE